MQLFTFSVERCQWRGIHFYKFLVIKKICDIQNYQLIPIKKTDMKGQLIIPSSGFIQALHFQ